MSTKFSPQKNKNKKNPPHIWGIIEGRLKEEFQDSFIANVYCPSGTTNTCYTQDLHKVQIQVMPSCKMCNQTDKLLPFRDHEHNYYCILKSS